jgi:ATP-dependent exoDNAse (exonuclease V) beta subunit
VAPGTYAPRRGSHRVVWWDAAPLVAPRPLVEPPDATEELRRDGSAAPASLAAFEAWRATRDAALQAGGRPTFAHQAFTRLALEESGGGPEVRVERAPRAGPNRPEGKRFGSLVHAVLAEVAWQPGAAEVAKLCAMHARKLGCPPEERDAARVAVERALEHPVMRRAARSPECRRECPVLTVQADSSLAEGVVDLAFRDPDGPGWVVVDFKTDAELGERQSAYQNQVRLYVAAVERATGLPAEGLLLLV